MCVILHRLKGNNISEKHLLKAKDFNPDGFGIMYVENNKVLFEKGFIKDNELLDKIKELGDREFVLHFRIKTHGKIDKNNCHPFPVGNGVYMMHNGQLFIKTPNKDKSDTFHFADYLKKHRFDINNKQHLNSIEKTQCSHKVYKNRLVFMSNKKVVRLGDWSMLDGNYWSNLRWKEENLIGFYNDWFSRGSNTSNYRYHDYDYEEEFFDTFVKCVRCKDHIAMNKCFWSAKAGGYLCKGDCNFAEEKHIVNIPENDYENCQNCGKSKNDLVDNICGDCEDRFVIQTKKCWQCQKNKSLQVFDSKVELCNDCIRDNNITYGRDYVPCTKCNLHKPIEDSSYCLKCSAEEDTVVIEDDNFIECPQCYGYDSSDNFNCGFCNNTKVAVKCQTCQGEGSTGKFREKYCDDCCGVGCFPFKEEDKDDEEVRKYNFTFKFPTNQYKNTDISLIKHKINSSGIDILKNEGTFLDKKENVFRMKFLVLSTPSCLDMFLQENKNLQFSYRKS